MQLEVGKKYRSKQGSVYEVVSDDGTDCYPIRARYVSGYKYGHDDEVLFCRDGRWTDSNALPSYALTEEITETATMDEITDSFLVPFNMPSVEVTSVEGEWPKDEPLPASMSVLSGCDCGKEKFGFMMHDRQCPEYIGPTETSSHIAAMEMKQEIERIEAQSHRYMAPGDVLALNPVNLQ